MMWSLKTNKNVEMPLKVSQFLDDYEELCKKHNLSLSHEDGNGSMIIEPFMEVNIRWAKNAMLDIEE